MRSLLRFVPYCAIGAWLGGTIVVLNVVLSGLAATPVLAWLPKTVAGTGYIDDSRSRVNAALDEYRQGRVTSVDHLGAFVGISNVREGVELKTVSEAAGPSWHFLGLAGAGLGIGDVSKYADLLLDSDLHPDIVVLGISLHQLVDTRPKPGTVNVGWFDYARRGDLRNTLTALRDDMWMYARRQDVSGAADTAMLDGRQWLFTKFNVRLRQPGDDHRSPWREMIKSDWPEHFSTATLREEEQFFADLGVFDRSVYERSPVAMSTLLRIVDAFHAKGSDVVVLLMPEHSTLRRRIPDTVDELERRLRALPGGSPQLLDMRAVVPDDGFVDLSHLNHAGSREFSRLLAATMRDHLPKRPPAMAQRGADASLREN